MNKIAAYILSGGKNSRFKSDKARALYKNKPLIIHMAESIAPFTSSATAVADKADKYRDLGLDTIADLLPDLGPIGGLYTALEHCPDDWLLLTSCDWLGIKADWIKTLLTHSQTENKAIAYRETFWQPLLALYHKSCIPAVKGQIDANDLALQHLLDPLNPLTLPLPNDWSTACQINTPQALQVYSERP